MTVIDFSVIFFFLSTIVGCGLYVGRGITNEQDFCLGKNQTPWWAIGLSVFATYTSALAFLGGPGWSYQDGLQTLILQANFPIVAYVVARYFVPIFYNLRLVSIYEFYYKRFGRKTEILSSSFFLITQVVSSAGILFTTALVISNLIGIEIVYSILIVSFLTILYAGSGGITAVLWTDVIQSMILLVVVGITFYLVFSEFSELGGKFSDFSRSEATEIFNFGADTDNKYSFWAAFVAMSFYRVQASGTSQLIIQRTLSAKNLRDAQLSVKVMGYLATPTLFIMLFIGLMLYFIFQGKSFDNNNTIILDYLSSLKVPGLIGLVVSAIFAASMSSLDSALNSLSTVTLRTFFKDTKRDRMRLLKLFTVIWLGLMIVPAYLFSTSENSILENVVKFGGYIAGAELGLFVMAYFSTKTSESTILFSSLLSICSVFLVSSLTSIAWPWYCLIGFGTTVIICTFLNFFKSRRESGDISHLTFFERESSSPSKSIWTDSLLLFYMLGIIIFLYLVGN